METIEEIKKQLSSEYITQQKVIDKYGLDISKTFEEQFSKVSIESIIFYIVAYVIWLREKAQQSWLKDVEATGLATRYGTKEWWWKKALEWQKGDQSVVIDDQSVGYLTQDETKQIIKYAAISQENNTVYIKVAKEDGGTLGKLATGELDAFNAYLQNVKPAGINVVAQSYDADVLSVSVELYVSPERIPSTVIEEAKTKIKEYINNIKFGGVVNCNRMIDALQEVEGVKDVVLRSVKIGSAQVQREGKGQSGYYTIDESQKYIKVTPYYE